METWIVSVGSQIPIPLLTVLMIYFGILITKSQYLFAVKQMEYWREIALMNEKTMATQSETIRTFTVTAELQKQVMEAIQRKAGGDHRDSLAERDN